MTKTKKTPQFSEKGERERAQTPAVSNVTITSTTGSRPPSWASLRRALAVVTVAVLPLSACGYRHKYEKAVLERDFARDDLITLREDVASAKRDARYAQRSLDTTQDELKESRSDATHWRERVAYLEGERIAREKSHSETISLFGHLTDMLVKAWRSPPRSRSLMDELVRAYRAGVSIDFQFSSCPNNRCERNRDP